MLVTRIYAVVEDGGWIQQTLAVEEEGEGPSVEKPGGYDYRLLNEPVDWCAPRSSTSRLRWKGFGVYPEWEETQMLDEIKVSKNAEINAARLEANRSYFDFAGKQIACDEVSMLDIQSANAEISLTREMPANWPGAWKAKDNAYALIPDVATWTDFIKAMVSRGTAHFQRAQALKAQLAAATTAEEIALIVW